MRSSWLAAAGVIGCGASAAFGQSDVDPAHRFSWQENVGWMNWYDAGELQGEQGVMLAPTYLSGFVWAENVGYVNLGDGSPVNGASYANLNGGDFGVNVEAGTGLLSGLGWGENVGWINFSGGAMASPARPAQLDLAAERFRGFAWGENIGWVNLDDAVHYVGVVLPCAADWDLSGDVNSNDFFAFLTGYFASEADFDGDGQTNSNDFFAFLTEFFEGC